MSPFSAITFFITPGFLATIFLGVLFSSLFGIFLSSTLIVYFVPDDSISSHSILSGYLFSIFSFIFEISLYDFFNEYFFIPFLFNSFFSKFLISLFE